MPPNLLLLLSDDIPRNSHGAYGARHALSPTLDSLAADGITFTRAYATSPLCTPSRFSLLTGRFASNASSIAAHRPWNYVGFNTFLTGAERTVAHELTARANYSCGFVGKFHLGFPVPHARGGEGAAPTSYRGGARGLGYADIVETVRRNGGFEFASAVWGSNRQTAREPHHPEWMAAEAARFVVAALGQRRPFFLLFAGTVPHSPFSVPGSLLASLALTPAGRVPPEAVWGRERNATLSELRRHGLAAGSSREAEDASAALQRSAGRAGPAARSGYSEPVRVVDAGGGAIARASPRAAPAHPTPLIPASPPSTGLLSTPWLSPAWLGTAGDADPAVRQATRQQRSLARLFTAGLHWFDRSVGSLLGVLRERGAYHDTLVVYAADHGPSFLGKGAPYEAGVRVPLLLKPPASISPALFRAGARVDSAVALIDVFPTLLGAAGLSSAEVASGAVHGRSLLPVLRGEGGASDEQRPIFFEVGYLRGVLRHPWKLVVVHDPVDRCRPWRGDGTPCRNFHAERVQVAQCNFTSLQAAASERTRGACNMTYDAVARHARFCDRRQLYHLERDPLEQENVAERYGSEYDALLALLLAHVRHVEASNPAVARSLARQSNANHPCSRKRDGASSRLP